MRGRIWFYGCMMAMACMSILLQSCNTGKRLNTLVYFNERGDTALEKSVQRYEPAIQPGDRISIVVNALDPTSAAPYNLGSAASITSGSSLLNTGLTSPTTPTAQSNNGYLVEENGTIQFPQLGKIQVAGMRRKQLVDTLTQRLEKFVKDPLITVQFLNFKITVLGEVTRPGTINIPDGRVTLVEAIGLSGDLLITARRDNIMVIRENNGQREFGRVNMLSRNIFSSPYFVLKQNDVVYVELTKDKVTATDMSSSLLRNNISLAATALTVISTIVIVIINLRK
jgi:polysaccharide export outer membrane protein